MFKILLFKEIRDHMMTFRFAAGMVTTFVLIVFSAWVLGGNYVEKAEVFQKLTDKYQQEAEEIYVPSQLRPTIGYIPPKLSIFAQAESKLFGNFVRIERNEVPAKAPIKLTNNELLGSIATFDVLMVISIILSLFGILMSYDSINGERERGTLKQMMSYSISRASVFIAKLSGLLIVLLIPFVISMLAALIVLQFIFGISFSMSEWSALGLMFMAVVAYIAVFIGLGTLCSSLLRSSASSVVAAVLVWSTLVFLVPLAANKASELFVELYPEDEIENLKVQTYKERDEIMDEFTDELVRGISGSISASGASLDSSGYGRSWIFDGNANMFLYMTEIHKKAHPLWMERANIIWDTTKKHQDQKTKQANIANIFSFVSPAFHLRSAFSKLSGTSYEQQKDFMEKAREYRYQFLNNYDNKGYFGENAHLYLGRIPAPNCYSDEDYAKRWERYTALMEQNKDKDMNMLDRFSLIGDLPENLIPEFVYENTVVPMEPVLLHIIVLYISAFLFLVVGLYVFNRFDVR